MKTRENKVRKDLQKLGYGLHKSRGRNVPVDMGGYMIYDLEYNAVVAGPNYELSLEYVENYVREVAGCDE